MGMKDNDDDGKDDDDDGKDDDTYHSSLQVLTTLHGNPHIVYWRF